MVAFYLDDIPAAPVEVETPDELDVSLFESATADLVDPDGELVADAGLVAEIADDVVTVEFPPDESLLNLEGIYRLRVRLTGAGRSQGIPEFRFVVQDFGSGWHTLDTVREDWPDGERLDDVRLWEMLEVVRGQIAEFGTTLTGTAAYDATRYAQRVQTRNTWNAAGVDSSGGMGGEDFVIRPFPLDWHVKQILRPKRGIGSVA